jgi:cytochrome oxidase Cu insertion factor (SCO1/SenC/PrrC family)
MIKNKTNSVKQNKIKRISILLIIFGIGATFAFWSLLEAAEDPMSAFGVVKFNQGIIAPSFKVEDLYGKLVRLEDFRGKVVLLNFWTTW